MTCTYVSAIKHCFDIVWKFSSGRKSLFTSFLYAFRCNELRCLSCFTDSPAVVSQSSLLASAPGTPDLLVNSLALKRTLRKWSHDKEKVKEDGIIGDCFLVDIWFSPSRSSQVNPNSTRSIDWALEGFFRVRARAAGSFLRRHWSQWRLDSNWKSRVQRLWHPGYPFDANALLICFKALKYRN